MRKFLNLILFLTIHNYGQSQTISSIDDDGSEILNVY